MSLSIGGSPPPVPAIAQPVVPTAPTPPPTFGSSPIGLKPQAKNSQPTFLGGMAAQGSQLGSPSLIGGMAA